jgi:hypothetical protein
MNGRGFCRLSLLVLTACFCGSAVAQRTTFLTVSAFSYHLDRSRDYNERNGGAGIEHFVSENVALIGGFYRNSRPDGEGTSMYGGLTYTPLSYGPVRAGMVLGAVTGYQAARVLPSAGAVVTVGDRQSGLNVHFLPSGSNRTMFSTVGVQLKRAF